MRTVVLLKIVLIFTENYVNINIKYIFSFMMKIWWNVYNKKSDYNKILSLHKTTIVVTYWFQRAASLSIPYRMTFTTYIPLILFIDSFIFESERDSCVYYRIQQLLSLSCYHAKNMYIFYYCGKKSFRNSECCLKEIMDDFLCYKHFLEQIQELKIFY